MASWRSRGAAAAAPAPSRSAAAPRVDEASIAALFGQYADSEDPDWMSMTGFSKLAEVTLLCNHCYFRLVHFFNF
jgi:hypothetical protein